MNTLRRTLLLLVLLCVGTGLASCTAGVGSQDPESGFTFENELFGFQLDIPDHWAGEYMVEEQDDIISFYHKATWAEQERMGRIFDIHLFTAKRWEDEGQELSDMIGLQLIHQDDQRVFALGSPTDVQTIPGNITLRDDYLTMESEVKEIIATFRLAE